MDIKSFIEYWISFLKHEFNKEKYHYLSYPYYYEWFWYSVSGL